MKTNLAIDQFFHLVSRYIIFIPILVIGVALFLKFDQPSKIQSLQQTTTPTILPTAVPTSQPNTSINLDLNGPLSCQGKVDEITYTVAIKNKQILAAIVQNKKQNNFLISGDCLYQWEEGLYVGQKTCGLGQYLSLFESLNSLGIVNANIILDYLPKLGLQSKLPFDPNQIHTILSSCKKQPVDDRLFSIPKTVLFKSGSSIHQ